MAANVVSPPTKHNDPPSKRAASARRAGQVFLSRFANPEERSAYYAELGRRSQASRLTLTATEASALARAYELLGELAAKFPSSDA